MDEQGRPADSAARTATWAARCGLGAYDAKLAGNSHVAGIYGTTEISERHRHRYEVNAAYREPLEKGGLIFSGMSPDGQLPEIVERPDHPWFVGVQFHPELKSKPFDPHPLFAGFIHRQVRHQPAPPPNLPYHTISGGWEGGRAGAAHPRERIKNPPLLHCINQTLKSVPKSSRR
jgi:hypothetical protein